MGLSQQFLDKEDKWTNINSGKYSYLRVDIFKYLYEELSGLVQEHNDDITEKQVEHITEDILEFVDKFIDETTKQSKEKEAVS